MKRDYRKGNYRPKPRTERYTEGENSTPKPQEKPKDEATGKLSLGLMQAGLKDLPYPHNNTRAYQFRADPFAEPLIQANPYAIYNKGNKMIAAKYGGESNLDGGSAQSYTTAVDSAFLGCADFIRTRLYTNYNGLRTRPVPVGELRTTTYLIDEQRKVIAEALGTLLTTTFTELGINNYVIVTDMPMGTAVPATDEEIAALGLRDEEGNTYVVPGGCSVYYESVDVVYALTRFYQQYLQMVNDHIRWSNMFRLKQGEMIRSAYDREAPQLNFLFSNINKTALLNALEGLAMALKGEFFDTKHALTVMTATGTPSRAAEAMTSPLLEIQNMTLLPNKFVAFKLGGSTGTTDIHYPVYNLDKDAYVTEDTTTTRRIDELVEDAMDLLSAEDTMAWARSADFADATGKNANSARARANSYTYALQAMTQSFTKFKTKFTDVRQLLENAIPSGLIYWSKGYRPAIERGTNSALDRNITLEDIFRTIFSGDDNLVYNDVTKRFRASSLWNMYTGIPGYDDKSGGSFITVCFKSLSNVTSDPDMSIRKLPIFFQTSPSGNTTPEAYAVARNGVTLTITSQVVTLSSNDTTRRLVPLSSQSQVKFRIPYATIANNPNNVSSTQLSAVRSFAVRMLVKLCGLAMTAANTNPQVDPDIIAIYTTEVTDITNMMIAFARNTSVFRGAVDIKTELGFAGI